VAREPGTEAKPCDRFQTVKPLGGEEPGRGHLDGTRLGPSQRQDFLAQEQTRREEGEHGLFRIAAFQIRKAHAVLRREPAQYGGLVQRGGRGGTREEGPGVGIGQLTQGDQSDQEIRQG
jgi:hypothetical protein